MIDATIFAALNSIAALNGNVHPLFCNATPRTYAVFVPLGDTRNLLLDGGGPYNTRSNYQIDLFAGTRAKVLALQAAIYAWHGYRGTWHGLNVGLIQCDKQLDDYLITEKLYRITIDVNIDHEEATS